MTLLEEIQDAAVDGNSDISMLLRKCKVLAAKLGSQPLESWLIWESSGYPESAEVPNYRFFELEVKGQFSGPGGVATLPIPSIYLPDRAKPLYERYACRASIAAIEKILKGSGIGKRLIVSASDLALLLGDVGEVYVGRNCIHAWAEFPAGNLVEIINAVRNGILDFILALQKEVPYAGNLKDGTASPSESSTATHIFNTTLYGGSFNLIGTANSSTITFNIAPNDFSSVEHVLREKGVGEEDVKELRTALESDQAPKKGEGFGPKVSAWIGKMMSKAADGSWKIAVDVGGTVLAKAIAAYYGLG